MIHSSEDDALLRISIWLQWLLCQISKRAKFSISESRGCPNAPYKFHFNPAHGSRGDIPVKQFQDDCHGYRIRTILTALNLHVTPIPQPSLSSM